MAHVFTGANTDTYQNNGKMWEIASRYNKESEKHLFDCFGNQLTKEVLTRNNELEVVAKYSAKEMKERQCLKHKTLNVSRRKVSESEYKPVGIL